MSDLKLYTIGFTKKSAEYFFEKLKKANVKRVIDVRLNNVSQLAGFAKKNDLIYFLKELDNIDYVHLPELAPTKRILDAYKKHKGEWAVYESEFLNLMEQRNIENTIPREMLEDGCLLCSEDKPHHCHRRLVAEYLKRKWADLDFKIRHLE